ncbi:bifunctional riboflavin kinase/FAD synthetase [Psychroserpens sp.]|uniref:bifunctional riboflavin kinase/FAD synthetase n=1 Tax=Psychroserpens sp. TaxID=2020870 RepID=UPI002AA77F88|nr:bifunctional riboflavin kinase/FAD synthetase [Psychroserpens sp.]
MEKKPERTEPSIITIGTFDGVHIGHQKIINRLVETGKENGLKSIVLTFFPHPRMVLQPDYNLKLLHSIDERQMLLTQYGVDEIIIKPFTKAFANLSAEAYVKNILVDELNAQHIIIGYDHHFGKNRSANIEDMRAFGKKYDFQIDEISAQDIQDVAVSSTKIRQALVDGDIETTNAYLGYSYFITGTVIKGKGVGKTIQFPTANISVESSYKLIPKNGVYVVASKWDGEVYYGMMNIGTNPTFDEKKQSIEVYFFNFEGNLYGKLLQIDILHRLRDEHKFSSVEALQSQLKKDQENAIHFIRTRYE